MKKTISAIAALSILATSGFAYTFHDIGYRATAMGNTGVTNASASLAGYYNPALLTERKYKVEINLGGGFGIRDNELAEKTYNLAEKGFVGALDSLSQDGTVTETERQALIYGLETIPTMNNNSFQLVPSGYFGMNIGNFGVGVYGTSEATAQSIVDKQRTRLIYLNENDGNYYEYDPYTDTTSTSSQTDYENYSLDYAIKNNLTYIKLNGLAVIEVPFSYAYKFNDVVKGDLSVGASVKFMKGYAYYGRTRIDTKSGDLSSKFEDSYKTSNDWGLDVGLLYQPYKYKNLKIGLTAKNLNSPSFDTDDPTIGKYELKPMVRAGVSYQWKSVTFALDSDLTSNDSYVYDGAKSRQIGGGIWFEPTSWLSAGVGLYKDLEYSKDGTIITAGADIGLKWFQFNISAQIATKQGQYDGEDVPRYAKVNFGIISRW